MILLIFFCFLLQSTLFQNIFAAAEIAPNFMVILTVSFGLMRGKREGMFVGFLGGILSDLFFGSALGFTALLYVIIGYCCGFCYRIFYDDDVKMPVILIAVSDIGYGTAMYLFQFLLRGQNMPVFDSENGKKDGGKQNNADRSPAVKGMQKAHYSLIVFERTGFDNGTDQHFDQATSDRINDHADQNTNVWIRKKFR